jgi:TPR repeat protein
LVKLECFEIILFNAFADDFKAFKFYQKACDLNDGNGCSNLGFMYKEGKGVKQEI